MFFGLDAPNALAAARREGGVLPPPEIREVVYTDDSETLKFVSIFNENETDPDREQDKDDFEPLEMALRALHKEAVRTRAIRIDEHYGRWKDNADIVQDGVNQRMDPVLQKVMRPIREKLLDIDEWHNERYYFMETMEKNFGKNWKLRLIPLNVPTVSPMQGTSGSGPNVRAMMVWSWISGLWALVNERHSYANTVKKALATDTDNQTEDGGPGPGGTGKHDDDAYKQKYNEILKLFKGFAKACIEEVIPNTITKALSNVTLTAAENGDENAGNPPALVNSEELKKNLIQTLQRDVITELNDCMSSKSKQYTQDGGDQPRSN